jgi:hypothetical protein
MSARWAVDNWGADLQRPQGVSPAWYDAFPTICGYQGFSGCLHLLNNVVKPMTSLTDSGGRRSKKSARAKATFNRRFDRQAGRRDVREKTLRRLAGCATDFGNRA